MHANKVTWLFFWVRHFHPGGSSFPPRLTGLEWRVFFINNSKTIKGIRLIFSGLIEVHKVYLQCKAWLSSYCSFCVILNSTKVRHFSPGRPQCRTWHKLCPFSAPRGTHFQLVPLSSPQGYFMGKFSPLISIKFLHPMPPFHPVQKWSKLFAPEKIEETWKNWLSTHYYYTRPSK